MTAEFVDQFDILAHLDLKANKRTAFQLPKGDVVSEPIFIPRNTYAREGDGYLLATIYRGAEKRSDLAIFDTVSLETGRDRLPHNPSTYILCSSR